MPERSWRSPWFLTFDLVANPLAAAGAPDAWTLFVAIQGELVDQLEFASDVGALAAAEKIEAAAEQDWLLARGGSEES